MDSSVPNSGNSSSQSDDPWRSIENEDYVLEEPNLNQIYVLMQDSGDTRRREQVKVVNTERSTSDQGASETQTLTVTKKELRKQSAVEDQSLEEFREDLRLKRMARLNAIDNLRNEITSLRRQLAEERELVRRLRNGEHVETENKDASTGTDEVPAVQHECDDTRTHSDIQPSLRSQLSKVQLSLQLANAENLSLSTELSVIRRQVTSLKEVITCSKQMIEVREQQVNQLKTKIREIEDSLAEREMKIMSTDLRQEYDRQLANIRNLRQLYEERARVCAAERENLIRQISIKKDELAVEIQRAKTLEDRISSLENELETSNNRISSLQSECNEFKFENRSLKEEMAVINKLFSQMLMGFNGGDNLDIDRLTTMLEENRSLLNEMATKEDTSEGASLPKLLFDIVRQANSEGTENAATSSSSSSSEGATASNQPEVVKVATAQEIIGNLPKVWRVLMELLSHHQIERVQFKENGQSEDCYKSVQTPSGPKAELSVSKTYIKLKDLILEKKSLQKETNKLKTLNTHLERRLNEQEKRLSTVSLELTKTWHLVGKMQRQHRQLHTNEQILRYQLHQKRRLLNELKDELEYCRRKWAAARAKNAESQLQCDDLRKEFAKRKLEDANLSAESGYSDGPVSDEDDDQPAVKRTFDEVFTNPKKIERMQSASPTRTPSGLMISRGKSAPPTTTFLADFTQTVDEISATMPLQNVASSSIVSEKPVVAIATHILAQSKVAGASSGAVPKQTVRLSRNKRRDSSKPKDEESLEEMFMRLSGQPVERSSSSSSDAEDDTKLNDRSEKIQQLEDQCKSLIEQVIETTENREKLEIQLCQFQDSLPPAQKPIPLEEYLAKKIVETKQDPFPETSDLLSKATHTANKRDERLKKLEEESKQLMSKIKRTTDRSRNMKSRIEKIRSRCSVSREGSTDSTASLDEVKQSLKSNKTDEDTCAASEKCGPSQHQQQAPNEEPEASNESHSNEESAGAQGASLNSCDISDREPSLTPKEIDYVTRRDERLKRLEEEGKQLLSKLSHTNERGDVLANRLDEIHDQAVSRSNDPAQPIENPSESSGPSADSQSATGKLEEVKRRLEESKKLLSQLSSDPDLNSDGTLSRLRSRTTSRQSESETNQDSPAVSVIQQTVAQTESSSEVVDETSEDASSSSVHQEQDNSDAQ